MQNVHLKSDAFLSKTVENWIFPVAITRTLAEQLKMLKHYVTPTTQQPSNVATSVWRVCFDIDTEWPVQRFRNQTSDPTLLTDDLSAGVVRRDGDSAGRTLVSFPQPHFHTGWAEHVVVGANDRLPDLFTTHIHRAEKTGALSDNVIPGNSRKQRTTPLVFRHNFDVTAAVWFSLGEPWLFNGSRTLLVLKPCWSVTFPRHIWHDMGKVRQRVDVWKFSAMLWRDTMKTHGAHFR